MITIGKMMLATLAAGFLSANAAVDGSAKSGRTRLCLELVKTEPAPVIGVNHPDAKDIPAGTNAWWRCIRVPHQLADEGNGLYTCFFSAYDKSGEFQSIGKATFRVKEIVEQP